MKNMNSKKRLDFLSTVKSIEAQKIINSYQVEIEKEFVNLEDACGRILADDFFSPEDFPYFDRSLVDGYAILSKNSQGASETNPVMLYKKGNVKVGEVPEVSVREGECVYLSTGALIPEGADSVIMQEYAREAGTIVEVLRPVYRGENVMKKGEDIKKGELLFRRGRRISPFDAGTFAALGVTRIPVFRRPVVGVLSTGDEIILPGEKATHGKVRDINRYVIMSLFNRLGGIVKDSGIAKDDIDEVIAKLYLLKDSDLLIISGGSSKGERDLIVEAVKRVGGKILFHGVNIKPGKPFFYASVWGKPLFGLPGHPLSCAIILHRFVLPLFLKIVGCENQRPRKVLGELTNNVPSSYGVEEYVNVKVRNDGKRVLVDPLFAKSAAISVFSISSGYIVVDEAREGFEEGEEVEVFLYEL